MQRLRENVLRLPSSCIFPKMTVMANESPRQTAGGLQKVIADTWREKNSNVINNTMRNESFQSV